MKKISILLIFIFVFISYNQTKYFVESQSYLSQVNWDKNVLNYIPIKSVDLDNSVVLDSTYNLLKPRKYSKLNKYISSVKTKNSDFYLAKAQYNISKLKYLEANQYLNNINDGQYQYVRDLLFVDLSYELAKPGKSRDYKKHLKAYQSIIDKYYGDQVLKKIIALRSRYVGYNH